MEWIAHAPPEFILTPRNKDRAVTIGGKNLLFGNVSLPPNHFDMAIAKKVPGTCEMCRDLLKLTQYFNGIHFAGGYARDWPTSWHGANAKVVRRRISSRQFSSRQ